jgi:sugar lactone lactonase YvrE
MTSLGDRLFLMSRREIAVYDAPTLTFQRLITIDDLRDVSLLYGIASCAVNNCLYVSDCVGNVVFKVSLSNETESRKQRKRKSPTSWAVCGQPMGLSVNGSEHVLVACQANDGLRQYTSCGTHVRTIKLQPDVGCPVHAIQLANNRFVVSRSVSSNREVYVVDGDGRSVARFEYNDTSVVSEADEPRQMAVDKNGFVFVSDSAKSRIAVWNPEWDWSCDLPLSRDAGMRRPSAVHLDESCSRLYVNESSENRLLAFDSVEIFEMNKTDPSSNDSLDCGKLAKECACSNSA